LSSAVRWRTVSTAALSNIPGIDTIPLTAWSEAPQLASRISSAETKGTRFSAGNGVGDGDKDQSLSRVCVKFVFVMDDARRKGIATKLIKACQKRWPGILLTEGVSVAGEALREHFEE
jgi:GNAT superfamily N-acetyltransferase